MVICEIQSCMVRRLLIVEKVEKNRFLWEPHVINQEIKFYMTLPQSYTLLTSNPMQSFLSGRQTAVTMNNLLPQNGLHWPARVTDIVVASNLQHQAH